MHEIRSVKYSVTIADCILFGPLGARSPSSADTSAKSLASFASSQPRPSSLNPHKLGPCNNRAS